MWKSVFVGCVIVRKFAHAQTTSHVSVSYSFALLTCYPSLLLTSLCSDTHFFHPYLHSILTPTSCAQVLNPLAVSTSCSLTLGHALSSDGLGDRVALSWGLHASHHTLIHRFVCFNVPHLNTPWRVMRGSVSNLRVKEVGKASFIKLFWIIHSKMQMCISMSPSQIV